MCLNWCNKNLFRADSSSSLSSKQGNNKSENNSGGMLNGNFLDNVTPGAFSFITQMHNPKSLSEQLTLDLNELKKQYKKLKERQRQAQIIIQTASAQHQLKSAAAASAANNSAPSSGSPQSPVASAAANASNKSSEVSAAMNSLMTSPFSLEQAPVINHLLIKPNDRNRNTFKQTIKLSSSGVPTTGGSMAVGSSMSSTAVNSDELVLDQNLVEKINHSKVENNILFLCILSMILIYFYR